jgi:hypothetical protein
MAADGRVCFLDAAQIDLTVSRRKADDAAANRAR